MIRRKTSAENGGCDAAAATITRGDEGVAEPRCQSTSNHLLKDFRRVREHSRLLCETLEPEDCVLQSMPDASPIRWHLAHTSWFFETFVLNRDPGYQVFDQCYPKLFNSYYNGAGKPFPRHQRGLLSRPTVAQVWQYRRHVDDQIERRFDRFGPDELQLIETGLHHEQQHQELMLTDLKHAFSINPMHPVYRSPNETSPLVTKQSELVSKRDDWISFDEHIVHIGSDGGSFSFDNEHPRHRRLVHAFDIASDLVTCGQYIEFINDGGYHNPDYWLSAGWNRIHQVDDPWTAPLYWTRTDDDWFHYTLTGFRPVELDRPITHLSYFEADAFARWRGCRLPTEVEWEHAAASHAADAYVRDRDRAIDECLHPTSVGDGAMRNLVGSVWQWTSSAYDAYPGYRVPDGVIGEYNGKFMCGQFVLRGGSCATPPGHARMTYRNFFSPDARWQFSGLRLARDNNGDANATESR